MQWLLYICIFFSDILCFDMSLSLLTGTMRGVSNKHCLLSLFILFQKLFSLFFCLNRTGQEAKKRLTGEIEILENQLEDVQDDNDRRNEKINKVEKDMRDMRVQLEHKIELG